MVTLAACIVTYNSPVEDVYRAVESLKRCSIPISIIIVDNHSSSRRKPGSSLSYAPAGLDPGFRRDDGSSYIASLTKAVDVPVIDSGGNRGFGAGHNFGFRQVGSGSDYFIIANPDIVVHDGAIEAMVEYMEAHPEVGLIAPRIVDEQGELQHLCKRIPAVLALIGRRFLPATVQRLPWIKKRLDHYVMRDCDYNSILEPDFISGCFMLFRSSVFEQIGGFDEQFFLYFEDTDITLRVKQQARAVYFPNATVTHAWRGGARGSARLTCIMMKSAFQFFQKWGWRWW